MLRGTKKYMRSVSRNLMASLSADITNGNKYYLDYKLIAAGIEDSLPIQSQFLYLLILTKTIPFMARKHPSKKKFRFGRNPHDTAKMVAYINQHRVGPVMRKFMYRIMPEQLSPELPAVTFSDIYTKIIA